MKKEKSKMKKEQENARIENMPKEEKDEEESTVTEETLEHNDDVEFEEVNEEGEVDAKDTIKKLRAKIKTLEKEKQEYLDGWSRAKADYANFKKETESRRSDDVKFAAKRLIVNLLPVLDAYDMARANQEAWQKVDSNWRVGIEYIFNQLIAVLEREGVKQYGTQGDTFDPYIHESVETVVTEDKGLENKLAQVLQKGYVMGETSLRPARVKVYEVQ